MRFEGKIRVVCGRCHGVQVEGELITLTGVLLVSALVFVVKN